MTILLSCKLLIFLLWLLICRWVLVSFVCLFVFYGLLTASVIENQMVKITISYSEYMYHRWKRNRSLLHSILFHNYFWTVRISRFPRLARPYFRQTTLNFLQCWTLSHGYIIVCGLVYFTVGVGDERVCQSGKHSSDGRCLALKTILYGIDSQKKIFSKNFEIPMR